MAKKIRHLTGYHVIPWFSRTKPLLYWTTMDDNLGDEWDWYFCNKLIDSKDRHVTGVCYLDRRVIILDALLTRNEDELYEVVKHELDHAAHSTYKGRAYKRFSEKDEHYAIYRSQYSSSVMLRSLGWKLPPLPRGIVSFRNGSVPWCENAQLLCEVLPS